MISIYYRDLDRSLNSFNKILRASVSMLINIILYISLWTLLLTEYLKTLWLVTRCWKDCIKVLYMGQ